MISRIHGKLRKLIQLQKNTLQARGKTKYFCIGRNKTGTTSLKKAFEDFGYPVGDQHSAEVLAARYYFDGNFSPIINYCKTAQVFQDVPFSWSETFRHVDQAYPGSKFILTVRDNPDQWYNSIRKFHAKKFGKGTIATADDLRQAKYVCKGFMYKAVKLHGVPDDDMYNKETMIAHYEKYNRDVCEYFKNRPNDFIQINVARKDDFKRFVDFLGVKTILEGFPWENKT